jgi:hypothetical protein
MVLEVRSIVECRDVKGTGEGARGVYGRTCAEKLVKIYSSPLDLRIAR